MDFQKLNTYTGWGVFATALLVYLLTVAPTASFWDCGEFIACSNELEVTHPPGAPLFLLLGRLMAMLSFGKVENIAFMVNLISVFASAFTAMFTCWITTALGKKAWRDSGLDEQRHNYAVLLAGVVAGLCCIFADSVWFNAVEAEVYALSGFFTAIVVWLMLKWEARADEPDNLKWLILIVYLMGLSIGVHLLNLLTIPALGVLYYFRKFTPSWKGLLATLAVSVLILAFVQYGIIQYTFSLAQQFELFFTGSTTREGTDAGGMGMVMGTGMRFLGLLIVLLCVGLLALAHRLQNQVLATAVLSYIVIMIGFSSYAVIFVRSGANPAIDMNNPENIMTFLSYMRREQYGDRPLLYGARYNSRPTGLKTEGMRYMILDGKPKYIEDEEKQGYEYEAGAEVLLPRMYSGESRHINDPDFGYAEFVSDKGGTSSPYDDKPTKLDEAKFFFSYQFIHMYLRYFMWNFVGRSSDVQDYAWEDGLLIRSKNMQDNKGNNHYFFLPFILGIMGLVWHFSYKKRDAAIVGLLFFFTGIAIILYLNQPPAQPRERDYAYASSFQTFCIWIGLGVLFLVDLMRTQLKDKSMYVAGGIALLAPLLMATQNWDDHSRKGRWVDVDFAYNLLNSCAKNAVLFTAGDNDTFPLWYLQEVEGVRTDVRVVNLELLISDWYIEQMQRKANDSEPLPITMKKSDYAGEKYNYYEYSSRIIPLPVNKAQVIANGVVQPEDQARLLDTLYWSVPAQGRAGDQYILRKDSALINLVRNVAQAGWSRPIYFSNTIDPASHLGLDEYLQMEGFAHRLVPLRQLPETPGDMYGDGSIQQRLMYDNLVNKFRYRELDNPKVNLDEHIRGSIISNYRNTFQRLGVSYSEQINLCNYQLEMAKTGRTDTLAKMGTDSERVLRDNPAKVANAQKSLRAIDSFMRKTFPYDVIKPNLNFLIMNAQMLYRADLGAEAKQEFSRLEAETMGQLSYYASEDIKVDTRHPAFQGAYMSAQYFYETGDSLRANAIADRLERLTGQAGIKALIRSRKLQ